VALNAIHMVDVRRNKDGAPKQAQIQVTPSTVLSLIHHESVNGLRLCDAWNGSARVLYCSALTVPEAPSRTPVDCCRDVIVIRFA
jgi:hypothetical protein